MDIRHYFDPVDFSNFHYSELLTRKYTLGSGIEKTMSSFSPEIADQIDVAILGIPIDSRHASGESMAPDKIRNELYKLTIIDKQTIIADFGNLKSTNNSRENFRAIRDIVEYFNELNVTVIILGGSQDQTVGICQAFQNNPFFSLTVVDARLDVKSGKEPLTSANYLSQVFKVNPKVFQFNLIGYQSYFVAPENLTKIKGISQHFRIGLLREDTTLVEPVFRNSDVVSFDIAAVKYADAPGNNAVSPNGLHSEEACQISRYAGIANRVKVFGLFETAPDDTVHISSVKLASQIVWYFLEGFSNRFGENFSDDINNIIYKVEVKDVDHPLVFIKDPGTGRWWMEIKTFRDDTRYFACSEKEYLQASNNEIPELWLNYVQKSDEILK